MRDSLPVIAIVGRPNVGKSTLFNALLRRRMAIVGDRPGVTVDRLETCWKLGDRTVTLVDTGGIGLPEQDDLRRAIAQQVSAALDVADLVLFVVDGTAGMSAADEWLAERLRRQNVPVVVAVNKAENPDTALEFHALGMGDPIPVSALHRHGLDRLRKALLQSLPPPLESAAPAAEVWARIAVIGKPNVGKSTLINAWLGFERMVVAPRAGTTRDAVDTTMPYTLDGKRGMIRLVDTAGMRRQARIKDNIEFVARLMARHACARADAAVLLLDAGEEVSEQDVRLMSLAQEEGCALVVAVNKVDLLSQEKWRHYSERLAFRMRGMPDVPVFRVAAKFGRGVRALLAQAVRAARRNAFRGGTGELNRWLASVQKQQPAPSDEGAAVRLKYCTQLSTRPPVIKVFCNRPRAVRQSYRRYLEHHFREYFKLPGVPLRLLFSATKNPYSGRS